MRVMNRAWGHFADAHGGMAAALASDAVFRNATRWALKLGEHTWGRDVKSNLFDNYDWTNADFQRAKATVVGTGGGSTQRCPGGGEGGGME